MCLSLPPHQRVSEFQTDDGTAYVWTLLEGISGAHSVTWEWFAPSGALYRQDGPVSINVNATRYPVFPLSQSLVLGDAAVRSQPGTWRVAVNIDGQTLDAHGFDIVSVKTIGDYGDAPDGELCGYSSDPALDVFGRFPTRYDSANVRLPGELGAHALIGGEAALGDPRLTSLEQGADDAQDPDGTANLVDDDIDDGLSVTLLSSGSLAFSVRVAASEIASPRVRYLNVLYDVNRDGEWRSTPTTSEWIVVNRPITLDPGETKGISIPLPLETDWVSSLSQPRWLRLVFSDSAISEAKYSAIGGWDGSGQFSRGEVEDHKIGVASAHDIAWSARQASRISWATARAHAFSLAWSYSQAWTKVTATSAAYASALVYVAAAATAADEASAYASAAAYAYQRAVADAQAFAVASVSTPCANVTAWASASISAVLEAAAHASANAFAASGAAAEAHAQALAWAEAIAVALADAEASAGAFAVAVANAYAQASAFASSWASASAWADAWAQASGSDALATALALAWAQAQAWATTSVSVTTTASTWTLAFSYAEAIASAWSYASVGVLAAAEASASAEAWAVAAANASAIAATSIQILTNAAAGASASVIEDCCESFTDCPPPPPCDSCCPPPPACDSCCPPPDYDDKVIENGGEPNCRDQWGTIPYDIQDAIVRLAYVTGEEARWEGWSASERRFNSKYDIKQHVDLWDSSCWRGTQMYRDANDMNLLVVTAIGDERTQLLELWQMMFNLGYSGARVPDCFDVKIPDHYEYEGGDC